MLELPFGILLPLSLQHSERYLRPFVALCQWRRKVVRGGAIRPGQHFPRGGILRSNKMFSGMEKIEREREIASNCVDKYRNVRNL